jgi:zinc transport system substrate-binding protein
MKKLILLMIFVLCLAACNNGIPAESHDTESRPLRVIATIFPPYDFVRRIAGDRVDLSMLISPGAESHIFEPTPHDMVSIGDADLLIHIGGHKDEWVGSAIKSVGNENIRLVPLAEIAGELVAEFHIECDGCCEEEDEHIHDDFDVHVWTCPRRVIEIAGNLADILSEMDSANADFYRQNADDFIAELQELDNEFVNAAENGVRDIIVFGDRFPFRYFVNTYGLRAVAAFDGCCVDTSVAPGTVASIITMVENLDIPVVFYIELSNKMVANTIGEATGAVLLEFHSTHNISSADFNAGVTYLDLMRRNVQNLRKALS